MDTSTRLRASDRVEKRVVINLTTWLDNTNLTDQPIANLAFRQISSYRLAWGYVRMEVDNETFWLYPVPDPTVITKDEYRAWENSITNYLAPHLIEAFEAEAIGLPIKMGVSDAVSIGPSVSLLPSPAIYLHSQTGYMLVLRGKASSGVVLSCGLWLNIELVDQVFSKDTMLADIRRMLSSLHRTPKNMGKATSRSQTPVRRKRRHMGAKVRHSIFPP